MVSRSIWSTLNILHGVVYSPSGKPTYDAIGLTDGWQSYFASRAAPLGAASAELVTATFYGWSPELVRCHIPAAWQVAAPEAVLAARLDIARAQLRGVDDQIGDTAALLLGVIEGLDLSGRPLAAAHVSLSRPEDPAGGLWHAATVLREYRGDSHWAVLGSAGISGAAANLLAVASGRLKRSQQRRTGWSDEAWHHAAEQLRVRGWLDENHDITDAGMQAREQLEDATDRVTLAGLDNEARARLVSAESAVRSLAGALAR